jgi:ribonuclease BN (tRNA processing enzyme)
VSGVAAIEPEHNTDLSGASADERSALVLHVLGASAVAPAPGAPCAGYLLQSASGNVLLDCGPGVLGPLRDVIALESLDAVVLSHVHPDHCLDLLMLRQALAFDPGVRRATPLPVWCGPGDVDLLVQWAEVFHSGESGFWAPHISLQTYVPDAGLVLAGITTRFARTTHTRPCWAMRCQVEAGDGAVDGAAPASGSVVYSGDTGPSQAVEGLACGADLLLLEATLLQRLGNEDATGHLAAQEAGAIAARAQVGRLLLTHTFASLGRTRLAAAAAVACPGIPVSVARAGDVWRV